MVVGTPTVLLFEDFTGAIGTPPFRGWTTKLIAGNPATDVWSFNNPGNRSPSRLTGPFAIYDSDFLSNDKTPENIALVSPVFDASRVSSLFLQFDRDYVGFTNSEFASRAIVETFNGTTWIPIDTTEINGRVQRTKKLDLSQIAGVANAQIRFRYEGNWSQYWAIDNIRVVDRFLPGVSGPVKPVTVSEDNVPDPLNFTFDLESRPTAAVTIDFTVDGTQLQAINSLTFTPDNWNISQTAVVSAVADGLDEGNNQVSNVKVSVTSSDLNYNGLKIADIPVQITDNTIPGFNSYRTVEKTYRDLSQLAADNFDIASWVDIGDSYDKFTPGGRAGYDIFAIELTNKSNLNPNKPTLFVQGALHAREYTTTEMVTRFAEELVAGYGQNPDTTWLLDNFKVVVVPIVNPDGRKFAEQGYLWRKNTNPNPPAGVAPAPFPNYGVDLNRNYDAKWGQIPGGSSGNPNSNVYRGDAPFSEPETRAVRDYILSLFPDQRGPGELDAAPNNATGVYLDVHSFGNLILYPWGSTNLPAPNKKQLETLGRKFGFFTGLDGSAYDVEQTVGLYPTDGSSDGWVYGELGVASYTFELGTAFFEKSSFFENTIVNEIMPSLLYAAKSAYRPYQMPAGPETIDVKTNLTHVTAGTPVTLTATANDTRYNDGALSPNDSGAEPTQNIVQAFYTINQLPWAAGATRYALNPVDGTFNTPVENLSATIDTTNLAPGRYTIYLQSQDDQGNLGVPTATFIEVTDPTDFIGRDLISGSLNRDALRSGRDFIGDRDIISALDGNDLIDVSNALGGNEIFGGLGADRIVSGTNDSIFAGVGNDTLDASLSRGNNMIFGEAGNDVFFGGNNDTLNGGANNDTFYLNGPGNNQVTGGLGADAFWIFQDVLPTFANTIVDFQLGTDVLGLGGRVFTFSDLTITQRDLSTTSISVLNQEIALLANTQATSLTAANFAFG